MPSDPVKIGVLAIRAGIAAPVGTAGLRGTEWWTERVNKSGGILGRPVQLVVEEESNPKDTVERYRKLILQDKVETALEKISDIPVGEVLQQLRSTLESAKSLIDGGDLRGALKNLERGLASADRTLAQAERTRFS